MPLPHAETPSPVEGQLAFQTLVSDLIARFVNLPPASVSGELGDALRRLCTSLGLDRATLWSLVPALPASGARLCLEASYQVEGGPPLPQTAEAPALFPWANTRLAQGEAVSFTDLADLPPEAEQDRGSFRRYGTKSALLLPLLAGGHPIGACSFAMFRAPRTWTEDLARRLRVCADVFANALERRRSDLALREATANLVKAQEQERARLARELHDDVTQRIASLSIKLGLLSARLDAKDAMARVKSLHDDIVRLSEDVHGLAYRLHPTILQDLGLVEALRTECARVRAESAAEVTADLLVPGTPGGDEALCLFRVAQEALRNAVRHGRASRIVVTLREAEGGARLTVRDDGAGFDAASAGGTGHLGLASMRQRVALLDGRFSVESAAGRGTTVTAWVPLPVPSGGR